MRVCPLVRRNRLSVTTSTCCRSCSSANLSRRPLGQQAAFEMSTKCDPIQPGQQQSGRQAFQALGQPERSSRLASTVADLRTLAVAAFCSSNTLAWPGVGRALSSSSSEAVRPTGTVHTRSMGREVCAWLHQSAKERSAFGSMRSGTGNANSGRDDADRCTPAQHS